jgi:hypothetical protein
MDAFGSHVCRLASIRAPYPPYLGRSSAASVPHKRVILKRFLFDENHGEQEPAQYPQVTNGTLNNSR